MAKLMAPNIRIDWFAEDHFVSAVEPTLEELNSGDNISPAVVTGFTLDFMDSNTEDVTTIFDHFTSEAILNYSYEGNLQYFLAPRGSDAENEAAYRKVEELFYDNTSATGYFVKRFGYLWNTPYEETQKIDIFKFQADIPKVMSEDEGPIMLNIRYLPQGEAKSAHIL